MLNAIAEASKFLAKALLADDAHLTPLWHSVSFSALRILKRPIANKTQDGKPKPYIFQLILILMQVLNHVRLFFLHAQEIMQP